MHSFLFCKNVIIWQEYPLDQAVRFACWSFCIPLNLFHFSYSTMTRDSLVNSRTVFVKRKLSSKLRWNAIQKVVILEWAVDIEAFFRPLILHRLSRASLKLILCRLLHGFWSFISLCLVASCVCFTSCYDAGLAFRIGGPSGGTPLTKYLTFVC